METAKHIVSRNQKQFQDENCGLWKIQHTENKTIIGYTGLWYFFEEDQPQLIYAMIEPFTRQGFAKPSWTFGGYGCRNG